MVNIVIIFFAKCGKKRLKLFFAFYSSCIFSLYDLFPFPTSASSIHLIILDCIYKYSLTTYPILSIGVHIKMYNIVLALKEFMI